MSRPWTRPLRSLLLVTALLAALAVVAPAAGRADDSTARLGGGGGGKVTLVAYSTPQEAYEKIIPLFQATPDGKGVKFDQSYGASGEQSRAVEGGLPADVVAFSLSPDVDRLVDAGPGGQRLGQDQERRLRDELGGGRSRCARATPRTSRRGTTC